jgi:hypothetical protein
MTHASRGNLTKATLFAGDADFIPLIKSLVGEGLHVTLWHPAQANTELKGAADSTRLFDFQTSFTCLTADGQHPAFLRRSSGGGSYGGPATDGLSNVVVVGDYKFAQTMAARSGLRPLPSLLSLLRSLRLDLRQPQPRGRTPRLSKPTDTLKIQPASSGVEASSLDSRVIPPASPRGRRTMRPGSPPWAMYGAPERVAHDTGTLGIRFKTTGQGERKTFHLPS